MAKAKTVHVIGNDPATISMFANAGWNCFDSQADLVCFTGGADVSPELYCHQNTASSTSPHRDLAEVGQYLKYLRMGVPMVGICRGGQFLNVMNGGTMVQHLDKPHYMGKRRVQLLDHKGNQRVHDSDNTKKVVPWLHEDHHQGMVPTDAGIVIGRDAIDGTAEIILYNYFSYPKARHLCFQAHPEWGHDPTRVLFFNLLEEYLL